MHKIILPGGIARKGQSEVRVPKLLLKEDIQFMTSAIGEMLQPGVFLKKYKIG